MRYRKAELEALAGAVGDHWGGRAQDWTLVVEPRPDTVSASAILYVEIGFEDCTPTTTVSLGVPVFSNDHAWAAHKAESVCIAKTNARGRTHVVAAVRRSTLDTLGEQCLGKDIEPLLGYLRCCGVLVIE